MVFTLSNKGGNEHSDPLLAIRSTNQSGEYLAKLSKGVPVRFCPSLTIHSYYPTTQKWHKTANLVTEGLSYKSFILNELFDSRGVAAAVRT